MAPSARLAASAALLALAAAQSSSSNCSAAAPSFYTSAHGALLLNGSLLSWSGYTGRVLALTNVASF